jgi:hypothetical protein
MTLFLITLFFWPFVLWLYTRNIKLAGFVFGIICLFLFVHRNFLAGDFTVTHDCKAAINDISEICRVLETISFTELFSNLSVWDPYSNCGRSYFLYFYPLYYMFSMVNCYLSPIQLDMISLFNILTLNQVIGFSTGMCLISLIIVRNNYASLFIFVSCLFSNLLTTSMIQNSPLLGLLYFAYLVFFVLLWFFTARAWAYFMAVILLGLCLFAYLPSIIVYPLGIFLMFYGFARYGGNGFIQRLISIRPKIRVVLLSLIVFAASISLFAHQFFEMRELVSPARGGDPIGVKTDFAKVKGLSDEIKGHSALISDFLTFSVDTPFSVANHVWHYAGPFVACFAVIGLFAGCFSNKRKIVIALFFTSLILVIISLGYRSPLFPLLNSIPILNTLRHYMFFTSYVFFFITLLSAIGFSLWMKAISTHSNQLEHLLVVLCSIALVLFYLLNCDVKGIGASILLLLILFIARVFSLHGRFSMKNVVSVSAGMLIVAVLLLLIPYQANLLKSTAKPYDLISPEPVKIPTTRKYMFPPVDGFSGPWSMVHKEACVVDSPVAFLSGLFPPRTDWLLNVLYPGRNRIDTLRDDLTETIYTHGEHILGNDFPIFFFVPDFEIIPEGSVNNDDILNDSLEKMAQHYNKEIPQKVYFFKGDRIPPAISMPPHRHKITSVNAVNIDQKTSTLHEIYASINAPAQGFIVRLENFNKYWNVTIDGVRDTIYRGNYAFQAFPVAKGFHKIHLTFDNPYPVLFILHQIVFYVGLVLLLWIGFRCKYTREI